MFCDSHLGCSAPPGDLELRRDAQSPVLGGCCRALHEMGPNCPGFGGFQGVLGVSRTILCSQPFFCRAVDPAGELGLLHASGDGQVLVSVPNWPQFLTVLQLGAAPRLVSNFSGRCFLPAPLRTWHRDGTKLPAFLGCSAPMSHVTSGNSAEGSGKR